VLFIETWKKSFDTFEANQATWLLFVQREHYPSDSILNKHRTFLNIEGKKEQMLATQKWCIQLCTTQIVSCQEETKDVYQKRWMLSSSVVRLRENFGTHNYVKALESMSRYMACL